MDRLAIVGPKDSVEHILRVCNQENLFEPIPLPYARLEECRQIIEDNRHRIDFWLFSGPIPYSYCLDQSLVSEKNAAYPPLNGRGLINTLFRAFRERINIQAVSFDLFPHSEVEETLQELRMEKLRYFTTGFPDDWDTEKLVSHHMKLWESGAADTVFTCIGSVYETLQATGIPVYRVSAPISVLRSTLHEIEQRVKTERYQLSSIVIMAIEVDYPVELSKFSFSYQYKKRHTQLHYGLLDFAEKINGSLFQSTTNLFLLFTTSGELANFLQKQSPYEFLHNLKAMYEVVARIGIGYGLNVHLAEKNVQKALEHAKRYANSTIFEVREDGSVHGPLELAGKGNDQEPYSVYKHNRKLKEAGLSPLLLSRLEAISKQYGIKEVTPSYLADFLKVTERNARRILQEMERAGLATHVRIEQTEGRGRPRKVYKIFH
ncbi:hypothetical protein [Brevibacillus fulvus]|uniref:Transcriptional regulator n=1 Tax=Brevibacillus fulvus TaxID=1125967 RepID=A0A939BVK5_9BACL|nr:hypothetical protein [Brevibacillus fulvus]MBM7591559.1 hypothetical protein [Brevibacillus fulvus]